MVKGTSGGLHYSHITYLMFVVICWDTPTANNGVRQQNCSARVCCSAWGQLSTNSSVETETTGMMKGIIRNYNSNGVTAVFFAAFWQVGQLSLCCWHSISIWRFKFKFQFVGHLNFISQHRVCQVFINSIMRCSVTAETSKLLNYTLVG